MNRASQLKKLLNQSHYALESATAREGDRKQYDYQLYPGRLRNLLSTTGEDALRIIPIGDSEADPDYWVIPYGLLRDLLVEANLTHDRRWRFHIENQSFVLYPGSRRRLGNVDVCRYYGVQLPSQSDALARDFALNWRIGARTAAFIARVAKLAEALGRPRLE